MSKGDTDRTKDKARFDANYAGIDWSKVEVGIDPGCDSGDAWVYQCPLCLHQSETKGPDPIKLSDCPSCRGVL